MGGIFISYRREDSEGQARALSIELAKRIGNDLVFMDVDSLALGRDFRQSLNKSLESCDALLALIGPKWLDVKDGAGRRRLEDPDDFVRQEISTALKRDIPVTPVLLRDAAMPRKEQLPNDLKELAFRSGFNLRNEQWRSGVAEMARRLGLPDEKAATGWTEMLSQVLNAVVEGRKRPTAPASPIAGPATFSLAQIIPGQWRLDITYPNGMSGQATALFEPSGSFRAEGRSRVATFTLGGTWRADSSDQVSLRGHQFDGVQTIPYNAVVGFSDVRASAMVGALNTGERVVWRRIR